MFTSAIPFILFYLLFSIRQKCVCVYAVFMCDLVALFLFYTDLQYHLSGAVRAHKRTYARSLF